jgi:cell division inhibitor SulA
MFATSSGIDIPEVSGTADRPDLDSLLQHPAIWRGRSAAQVAVVPSGYDALDEALPGGGWPRTGLIEILTSHSGVGELLVLLPALAALTRKASARWCAWIAPPHEPFAPALAAHGVALGRLFVARAEKPLWAFEQSLVSGACDVVLTWLTRTSAKDLRRLQLAAGKGRALGVLFRPLSAARESSSAVLRIAMEPLERGARITLLKSRGGYRGNIDLQWPYQLTQALSAQGSAGFSQSAKEGDVNSSFHPQRPDSHARSS